MAREIPGDDTAVGGEGELLESQVAYQTVDDMVVEAVARSFEAELAANPHQEPPTADVFGARLKAVIETAVPEIVQTSVDELLAQASAPDRLPALRVDRAAFRQVIRDEWGLALDALELLIHEFYSYGREYLAEEVRAGRAATDPVVRTFGRLHARACRTAREILYLLEDGLADGAFARCRTLHELTVVGLVLRQCGPGVAERYELHGVEQSARAMRKLDEHHQALGWAPVDAALMQSAQAQVAALRQRFGSSFGGDYGWAEGAVPRADPKRKLTLADLERAVGLAHYRPFFGWASESVHGGQQGLRSFGTAFMPREVLYSAGSITGLVDPGQHATLSLSQFVGALVAQPWSLDANVRIQILGDLALRCQHRFVQADTAVKEKMMATAQADAPIVDADE